MKGSVDSETVTATLPVNSSKTCFLAMLKTFRFVALLSSVVLSTVGMTFSAQAQNEATEVPPDFLGICGISNYSGRWIIDSSGRLIDLSEVCARRLAAQEAQEAVVVAVTSTDGNLFWQAFLNVASPEAIAFARNTGQPAVVEYGTTICPLLQTGNSMQDVRAIQLQGGLPPAFDAAVNVAAINTYCPQYQAQIGR